MGLALLKHLGPDGRLDPAHSTLAETAGVGERTVRRALAALSACGLVGWVRRLVRIGWQAHQISSAFVLRLAGQPVIPVRAHDGQRGRGTLKKIVAQQEPMPPGAVAAAQRALAAIRARRLALIAVQWRTGQTPSRALTN